MVCVCAAKKSSISFFYMASALVWGGESTKAGAAGCGDDAAVFCEVRISYRVLR